MKLINKGFNPQTSLTRELFIFYKFPSLPFLYEEFQKNDDE